MLSEKEKKIILILSIILLVGNQSFINYIIVFIISLLFLTVSLEEDILIYVFFIPWDRVLSVPKLGSIFRIFQIIILIKLIIYISRKNMNIRIKKYQMLLLIILCIYSIVGFICYRSIANLNVFINFFVLISVNYFNKSIYKKIYIFFVISVIIGEFYGVIHKRFIQSWISGQMISFPRFCGTYEPNFMGVYINCAIIILLTIQIQNKKMKNMGLILLYIGLILTVSISSILINCMIITFFIFLKFKNEKNKRKLFKMSLFSILILTSLVLILPKISIVKPVINRIQISVQDIINGNINKATSSRTSLSKDYMYMWKKESNLKKIFGTAQFSSKDLMEKQILAENYSHNSWLDLLITFGIITLMVIIVIVLYEIIAYLKKDLTKSLLILCIIFSAFGLSMTTNRIFWIWIFL